MSRFANNLIVNMTEENQIHFITVRVTFSLTYFNPQDGKHSLSEGSHVIALHPDYSFSYAPARVTGTDDNWFFALHFYDETQVGLGRTR